MNNIYSTHAYQQISELINATPVRLHLKSIDHPFNEINGNKTNNTLNLGLNAPYFFPNFLVQFREINKLSEILADLLEETRCLHLSSLNVRFPPSVFHNSIATMEYLLHSKGFRLTNVALWQTLHCHSFTSLEQYTDSLKSGAKKILRKFENLTHSCSEVDTSNITALENSYNLINQNRANIGTSLKYSFDYLVSLIDTFPNKIRIFDFSVDETVVASAICHSTETDILYVAAWGDAKHELKQSPMYAFAKALVGVCMRESIKFLDFGVSSDLNLQTPDLHKFKQNIGCSSAIQNTFTYNL